mmetsp:Transcript_6219/g.14979  ORF Transcript_6219/g.14979 Transcript_6219/m.14979 type:complete len:225 (-) Transcript_6219:296-970(-)
MRHFVALRAHRLCGVCVGLGAFALAVVAARVARRAVVHLGSRRRVVALAVVCRLAAVAVFAIAGVEGGVGHGLGADFAVLAVHFVLVGAHVLNRRHHELAALVAKLAALVTRRALLQHFGALGVEALLADHLRVRRALVLLGESLVLHADGAAVVVLLAAAVDELVVGRALGLLVRGGLLDAVVRCLVVARLGVARWAHHLAGLVLALGGRLVVSRSGGALLAG